MHSQPGGGGDENVLWPSGPQVLGRPVTDILQWIPPGEPDISTASYWNDVTKEEGKPFDLRRVSRERLMRYLEDETGWGREFQRLLDLAAARGRTPRGLGVDLGAGVGWTTALLSRLPEVATLYAVDFSRHRLAELAPLIFDTLGAETSKITRAVGSFYDVRLPAGSADFCFMSQAFHHADEPLRLLGEARRLLRDGGSVLIMGEDPVGPRSVVRRWASNLAKRCLPPSSAWRPPVGKLFPSFAELFPPDPVLGDRYYRFNDYLSLFREAGFRAGARRRAGRAIFVLEKA
jgi:SAM-dependent methyltransferase